MERLEPFRLSNRILDVGAGFGFFLHDCAQRDWHAYGVELSEHAVAFARQTFGLELVKGRLEDAGFADDFFDVVTFWNVLSHLADPAETLREVRRILRPGGAIMIRSPNATFHVPVRRAFEFLRRLWPISRCHDPTVFHLFAFDAVSFRRLLMETGFSDIDIANAVLAWTTRPGSHIAFHRRAFAWAVHRAACMMHRITAKRLVLGPSLLAVAVKPEGTSSEGKT